jgi:Fe-S cluster assembly iron-binding protein IscA
MSVLAISQVAAEVIKQIVSSSQISEEGGIRISAETVDNDSVRLDLALAERPGVDDKVLEEKGANVFVQQGVAPFLDDKVLDAAVDNDKVSFSIVDQQPNWSSNGQPKHFDPRSIS